MKMSFHSHGTVQSDFSAFIFHEFIMKIDLRIFAIELLCLVCAASAVAATRYVDANSATPTAPYTGWLTAATTIQDAIDVSSNGDEIVVTNGIYASGGRPASGLLTNRVAVDRLVSIRSVNGPLVTIIQGKQVPGTIFGDAAIRCVYLTNGASISGFTLTNGATRGVGGNQILEQSG